jgi:hypothetical protein
VWLSSTCSRCSMCGLLTLVSPVTHRGPPRRPPPHILDQVKALNQSLRLGHLLCRSRNPDFLLHIIQRQVSPPPGVLEGARPGQSQSFPHRQSALGYAVSTVSLSADGTDNMGPDVCCLPQADTCPAEGTLEPLQVRGFRVQGFC